MGTKKNAWACNGRTPIIFFEDNGRKNKKKNNGRLMGALPQFSFLFQFFFQKSPTGGTIYEYIGKYKEIGGQIAHDFFLA